MSDSLHILGIRHHGPGSSRAVLRALESIRPDCVLIEGPPDADEMIALAAHAQMKPPIALLLYQADNPQRAAYYPFADFSPEWNAIRWAQQNNVPARFMDLPYANRIAIETEQEKKLAQEVEKLAKQAESHEAPEVVNEVPPPPLAADHHDPLGQLARAAGFDDGERWWEHMVENRHDREADVFHAIREAMVALRETEAAPVESDEPLREASMRRIIREAQKDGHKKIAVICGAWHAPVLAAEVIDQSRKADDALLKGLAKVKTVATWVPWTYDRLTFASGYGAGLHSPGWYDHIWNSRSHLIERWLTRVARLLRDKDIDCSSAHVIEGVRLTQTLATMRGRPLADLSDISDATRAVFCFDSDLPMKLIARELLVGARLGEVPDDTPMVPLQQDLLKEQKRLRLKPEALEKQLDLDLRSEMDLARSHLLHRLRLLGLDWGVLQPRNSGKGTFHELWLLRWDPGYVVRLVEMGAWGNTIPQAAAAFVADLAAKSAELQTLAAMLGDVMLAELPDAVKSLIAQIESAAAVAADVSTLMDALPPLANVLRYGNVRQTDTEMVRHALDGMLPRITVALGAAVSSLNDDAAAAMEARIIAVNDALGLIENAEHTTAWQDCLRRITQQQSIHGLIRGRCMRLLLEASVVDSDAVAREMSLALSRGAGPKQSAAWIEGFLRGSGLLLLHDAKLLAVIDEWVSAIQQDVFDELIPLLRRTFSTFPRPERRQIGQQLTAGKNSAAAVATEIDVDHIRAARVLPLLKVLLGGKP